MPKMDGYYISGDYLGYNPETGKYDRRFETEVAYEEWFKENYEQNENTEE